MFFKKNKLANSKNGGGQFKNKNAFTLIELLAIIVILAIIAVITIPIILNVIDNSKRGAAIDSAYGYRDAIKKYYMSKMLDDNNYVIENGEHDVLSYINEGLDVSGEKPSQGWVIIENGDVTDFSIKIGDYVVTYDSTTNTTVAEKGSNVALTPTQEKAQNFLTSLKTAKGNVSDVFNLPVEGVSSTEVTSGWVALNNGEVIGYSLQVGDKTTTLSTKDDSVKSIVETLAQAYLNGLTAPGEEEVVDITESGYLKEGFIEYISNNSTISINDYSLKYEIDGVTKYANYDNTNNKLIVENTKHNKPLPPDPVAFSTDSWATIKRAIQENNTSLYEVGNTKTIYLDGINTPFTLRILNRTSCTLASDSSCGFIIGFDEVIENKVMNTNGSSTGGWAGSELRTYLNTTIYNKIPSEVRDLMMPVTVVSGHNNVDTTNNVAEETQDSINRLFLLSRQEVMGDNSSYDTASGSTITRQLDYYTRQDATRIKNMIGGSAITWWLRSAISYNSNNFNFINADGSRNSYYANGSSGVAPAFRIAD